MGAIVEWMTKPIHEYNFIDVILTFGIFIVVVVALLEWINKKGE